MINPNKLHRTKATIKEIHPFGESSYFVFELENGNRIESSYFRNDKIKQYKIGQLALIYVKFSIVGDDYYVTKLGRTYN